MGGGRLLVGLVGNLVAGAAIFSAGFFIHALKNLLEYNARQDAFSKKLNE